MNIYLYAQPCTYANLDLVWFGHVDVTHFNLEHVCTSLLPTLRYPLKLCMYSEVTNAFYLDC
jgi:hypothetical protein